MENATELPLNSQLSTLNYLSTLNVGVLIGLPEPPLSNRPNRWIHSMYANHINSHLLIALLWRASDTRRSTRHFIYIMIKFMYKTNGFMLKLGSLIKYSEHILKEIYLLKFLLFYYDRNFIWLNQKKIQIQLITKF